jgi:hypothetical protein
MDRKVTFETFFDEETLHPNAQLIKGVIYGYRIEEIDNELTQNVRYMDKLIDELAKGRKMEKILREGLKYFTTLTSLYFSTQFFFKKSLEVTFSTNNSTYFIF